MKKVVYSLLSLSLIAVVACNQAPKGTKTEVTDEHTGNAIEVGQAVTACNHQSKIYWTGTKPGGEHQGIINLKEGGKFLVDDDKLIGGEFIIDMNSIVDLDLENAEMNGKLVGHLKSADFFYVDSFPDAKFVITGVEELSGIPEFTHTIKGNLTMKNITKGISFKAKVSVVDGNVSARSENFVLDRTQWGVNYGSKSIFKELQDKFINDEFGLRIEAYSMK
ncbi:MAG TPA: YceI family protein [Marinilabiliales bacterium]|jgi:polyisoprenoid-binding protein YceI|nr:MAG: hypothetical protein A2W95_14660 [Bacteroidetes bacterium GWA2_40_14]OFX66302.1 MAG: hypothetical protein A2W84_09820 [Bacteroidetes bacterium GWC2_40_13]OFX74202.1 MAG: hypothetical protein A2W96_12935 [Bacteroidetes bacterium GWD2_40_43]OFX92964.1 MAG: hypothetical protein A2W97_05140 [Bacteroidetes bacterium GWE2_40_63]OFY21333.1 MAG: hypothetical protein A2W88_09135 [Bacteroidetes bacterium GWF2_40_13]OFZ30961.1 MAG: hypothetical protein A2437_15150 [Bacteroidetes bacterium RIFOXYC